MANALVQECLNQGASVLYLKAKNTIKSSFFVPIKEFITSADLEKLIVENVLNFDVIIHAAAVSDFRVVNDGKKLSSKLDQTIQLIPISKILPNIKLWNPKIKVVSFKAESNLSKEELFLKAKGVLDLNQSDLVVANDISANKIFANDKNKVLIIGKDGFKIETEYILKTEVAKIIAQTLHAL